MSVCTIAGGRLIYWPRRAHIVRRHGVMTEGEKVCVYLFGINVG